MITGAFIRAGFIFTICGVFLIALQSLTSGASVAKSAPLSIVPNSNLDDGTGAEQHPLHKVMPLVSPHIAPKLGTQHPEMRLKPGISLKDEIIERRSEQIRREDFSRNLECRRRQLRLQRTTKR